MPYRKKRQKVTHIRQVNFRTFVNALTICQNCRLSLFDFACAVLMINLQLNHERIINFLKNVARCTCPGIYVFLTTETFAEMGHCEIFRLARILSYAIL